MRRAGAVLVALALAVCGSVAAGCGLGKGEERAGGASIRITRDFGRTLLGAASVARVREDQTVMRLLRSEFDVETRFGGRFVQSIDGLEGRGAGGGADWLYFVNGVEAGDGAAEYELSPGDRVQWDYRPWDVAMRVPAIVGAFPEPFLHGLEGRRRPVRVECEDADAPVCAEAKERLQAVGVSPSGASIGAPGTETVTRLVVARWPRARIVRGAAGLEDGPEATGVFARFARGRRVLELLDDEGQVARRVEPGEGVGLVLAMRPRDDELVWLVTALDRRGLEAGVRALREDRLRDAFAVAVTGRTVEKLPLAAR
ncbi:MAG: DUF4430 domain-containing protein [Thermoleophilaceae bacterium]|nr:DUF4430 domain-containing protein [Thermoleophilaceae bacterium]